MFVSDVVNRELENKLLEMEFLGKRICLLISVTYLNITSKKLIIFKCKIGRKRFSFFSSWGLYVGFPQVKNKIDYFTMELHWQPCGVY